MERCSWPSRFIAQSQERARVSAKDESFLFFNSATGTLFVDGTAVAEESQDRQGTRPHRAADAARPRRRGNRIDCNLLRCICRLLALSGHACRSGLMSAFRGKADM